MWWLLCCCGNVGNWLVVLVGMFCVVIVYWVVGGVFECVGGVCV